MRTALILVVVIALVAGCGGAGPSEESEAPANTPPAAETPAAEPPVREKQAMGEMIRDPAQAIDVQWQWVGTVTPVEEITVDEPERYTIVLRSDGKLGARFDCNRGGGDYTIGEGTLSFGPMMSTKAMCPPESLDRRFVKDLGEVTSFFLSGGDLYLELPADAGTLRFRKASAGA